LIHLIRAFGFKICL